MEALARRFRRGAPRCGRRLHQHPRPAPDPATNIEGAAGGVVSELQIIDDDFDRWYLPRVRNAHAVGTDGTIAFVYMTGKCEKDGLVGYAAEFTPQQVQLTFVAGESGNDCDDSGNFHEAEITLDEPVGDRDVVSLNPTPRS